MVIGCQSLLTMPRRRMSRMEAQMVRRGARFPGLQDLAKAIPGGPFWASRRGEGASPGRKLVLREGRFRTSISRPDLRCPVLDYCKGPGLGPGGVGSADTCMISGGLFTLAVVVSGAREGCACACLGKAGGVTPTTRYVGYCAFLNARAC